MIKKQENKEKSKLSKTKNNKVKRLVMRDSPCEDVLDSPAMAPEKRLDGSKYIELVGEHQEEGMMSTVASFPSVMKPRFNRTSRSKETPQRCY